MSDIVKHWAEKFAPGSSPVKINLIGVAGSGMSGLASLFLDLGHQVSGSDRVTSGRDVTTPGAGAGFFQVPRPQSLSSAVRW